MPHDGSPRRSESRVGWWLGGGTYVVRKEQLVGFPAGPVPVEFGLGTSRVVAKPLSTGTRPTGERGTHFSPAPIWCVSRTLLFLAPQQIIGPAHEGAGEFHHQPNDVADPAPLSESVLDLEGVCGKCGKEDPHGNRNSRPNGRYVAGYPGPEREPETQNQDREATQDQPLQIAGFHGHDQAAVECYYYRPEEQLPQPRIGNLG